MLDAILQMDISKCKELLELYNAKKLEHTGSKKLQGFINNKRQFHTTFLGDKSIMISIAFI